MKTKLFKIAGLLCLTGCSPEKLPEIEVTKDQYGAKWPWYRFDRGIISCSQDQVMIKLGNVTYGLNGYARSQRSLPDPRDLMARAPGTERISADGRGIIQEGATDELIKLGLRLFSPQRR